MERYTMFLDWKNQYCENVYTTQSNLQIQCNPYQTTNGIFHRIRTKAFTICIETQKTPNNQSNLENEKRSWRNQAPWLQTILQSYSNQDSMVLAQKQKYRSVEQDRKPRDKPTHIWSPYTLSLIKEARIYSGEKTVSSISGAGVGLPWWHSGWEFACQCREYAFEPCSGRTPHAVEQLGPWATTTEPACLELVLHNKRGRDSEAHAPRWRVAPARHSWRKPLHKNEDPYTAKNK